jgi:halimadienyl-diphosphate synthase
MNRMTAILFADLQHLIAELGDNGGLISPSIYDTAQVLRYAPPQDVRPVITWLIDQQEPDGGWGTPGTPRARDVPTLAALLALQVHGDDQMVRQSIHAGLAFVAAHGRHPWQGPLSEDIPVGVELLLPRLLDEAANQHIFIDHTPYAELIKLGQRRRAMVANMRLHAGTTPIHSWEALDLPPTTDIIDGSGGIGHSPAATAAWLYATRQQHNLVSERRAAERYLENAAHATGSNIKGVVPTVWPITNFERVWGLFALQIAGMLDHPILEPLVERQLRLVEQSLQTTGIGMSDWFAGDGDITGTTLAMLAAAGRYYDPAIIQRFALSHPGAYNTYIGELQHSLSATAHAAHALSLLDEDPSAPLEFLLEHRTADGIWRGDKWHTSWLYLTGHTVAALCEAGRPQEALQALPFVLSHQREDGSWGERGSSMEETAYAVQLLSVLDRAGVLPTHGSRALEAATRWMIYHYRPFAADNEQVWIGKELYRPVRVVRAFHLSALLGVAELEDVLLLRC